VGKPFKHALAKNRIEIPEARRLLHGQRESGHLEVLGPHLLGNDGQRFDRVRW
jgi:hypothetical protein